jgi:HNH endonuclease
MSVTLKTRKLLWGRSGNRCAICRCALTKINDENSEHVVVGEEHHIIPRSSNGPRGSFASPRTNSDGYENLILLCRNHHKEVHDNPTYYTKPKLRQIKRAHERFVENRTDVLEFKHEGNQSDRVLTNHLVRLSSGEELLRILDGGEAWAHHCDDQRNRSEMNTIADFLQYCQDYCDLSNVLEVRDVVELKFSLTEELSRLEKLGFYVFGGRGVTRWGTPGNISPLSTVYLRVVRKNNREIIRL